MKNRWKMEISKDYTAWDLNCRHVVPHKKKHNRLERIFKRKNRRKIKKYLTNTATDAIPSIPQAIT